MESHCFYDTLKLLAYRHHESFHDSDLTYRIELAKQVLFNLETENWVHIDSWIQQSCLLEELDFKQQDVKQYISLMKFTMGNAIKTWLNHFIQTPVLGKKERKLGKNHHLYGPFDMGFSGPDMEFDLLCEKKLSKQIENVYYEQSKKGTVSLVLGAGNQNFLSFIDVLERIFIHKECVLLKHHPLRPFLFGPYGVLLEPLINEGIFHMILDNGLEMTQKLICCPIVSHVHFTGSEKTFASINQQLIMNNPRCKMSAELGCATPWVIFPGSWKNIELQNIAKMLVASKKANGGCNCLSVQLLILPSQWKLKDVFMEYLLIEIMDQKTFPAYYPYSRKRKEKWLTKYDENIVQIPSKERVSTLNNDQNNELKNYDDMSVILYGNIHPEDTIGKDLEYDCFFNEIFGPMLVCAELDYFNNDELEFTTNLCSYLNSDKVCGSLSCSLFIPSTFPEEYVEKCIVDLNYGTITINCSNVFGYSAAMMGGTWGSYYKDNRSGRGRIGNLYQLSNVTKTILRGKTLETMKVDLSKPPSQFFMDLLFVLIVRSSDGFDMIYNVLYFFLMKFLSIFTYVYSGIECT